MNFGAIKLRAHPHKNAEISRLIGVSRGAVGLWKKGTRKPYVDARKLLDTVFGIRPGDWDREIVDSALDEARAIAAADVAASSAARAKSAANRPPPPEPLPPKKPRVSPRTAAHRAPDPLAPTGPPPYPAPPHDPTVLEHARHSLSCLRHDMQYRSLVFSEVLKVRADELKLITVISKMQSAQELSESRYVTEHPAWVKLKGRILRALTPFPEAASAVAKALESKI